MLCRKFSRLGLVPTNFAIDRQGELESRRVQRSWKRPICGGAAACEISRSLLVDQEVGIKETLTLQRGVDEASINNEHFRNDASQPQAWRNDCVARRPHHCPAVYQELLVGDKRLSRAVSNRRYLLFDIVVVTAVTRLHLDCRQRIVAT